MGVNGRRYPRTNLLLPAYYAGMGHQRLSCDDGARRAARHFRARVMRVRRARVFELFARWATTTFYILRSITRAWRCANRICAGFTGKVLWWRTKRVGELFCAPPFRICALCLRRIAAARRLQATFARRLPTWM